MPTLRNEGEKSATKTDKVGALMKLTFKVGKQKIKKTKKHFKVFFKIHDKSVNYNMMEK